MQRLSHAWLHGLSPGDGMELLRHLALRRDTAAMIELARRIGPDRPSAASPFTATGLGYRAFRLGDPTAAYNLAMACFNRCDLGGYRRRLRRAAGGGYEDAGRALRQFEIRLPHGAAFDRAGAATPG